MSHVIGSGFIVVPFQWPTFRDVVAAKGLVTQCLTTASIYECFALDGPIVYTCEIYRGVVPAAVGILQGDNDVWEAEFEASYLEFVNQPVARTILRDGSGNIVSVSLDASDSKRRLEIAGKVAIVAPSAPPSTTAVTINASSPLALSSDHTTTHTITNGKTFHFQQVETGSEGDTSEKGSVVEVSYFDGAIEHLLARVYLNGFTVFVPFNDVSVARDGTAMTGDGSTKTIRVKRRRLSGSSQEVDAVVRGYEV